MPHTTPIHCRHTGCNAPQAECSGACIAELLRSAPEPQDERLTRAEDCTTAAALCLLGLAAIAAAGMCITAGLWLAEVLGYL